MVFSTPTKLHTGKGKKKGKEKATYSQVHSFECARWPRILACLIILYFDACRSYQTQQFKDQILSVKIQFLRKLEAWVGSHCLTYPQIYWKICIFWQRYAIFATHVFVWTDSSMLSANQFNLTNNEEIIQCRQMNQE